MMDVECLDFHSNVLISEENFPHEATNSKDHLRSNIEYKK